MLFALRLLRPFGNDNVAEKRRAGQLRHCGDPSMPFGGVSFRVFVAGNLLG